MERILVIDPGSVHTRGFLFELSGEKVYLTRSQTFLTTLSLVQMVEVVKKRMALPGAQVLVVSQPQEALTRSLSVFAAEGAAMGVELGAATTRLAVAYLGRTVKVKELPSGLGSGLPSWWEKANLEQVARWLSGREYADTAAVLNYLGMKSLYPAILPSSNWEVGIELAAAREILRQAHFARHLSLVVPAALVKLHFPRLILSGAVFSRNPKPEVLLATLDGLQLQGVWQVWIDRKGVLSALGKLSRWPGSFSGEEFGLVCLGTVVTLEHSFPSGKFLGTLALDLGLDQNQLLDLKADELVRVPLENGQSGKLSLELSAEVSITGSLEGHLIGGELGIIVDTRTRPVGKFSQHWLEALK